MGSSRGPSTAALVAGVVLLLVGGALLLRNTGAIRVDWGIVWPVIVIVVGVMIVLVAFRGPRRGTGVPTVSVPRDGSGGLELELRLGAGRYFLRAGSASLVDAQADEPTIAHHVERLADRTRVRLSTAVDAWTWGWRSGITWRIAIANDVPTVLNVQAGAGEFDLDLSDVQLRSASMGIGAADLKVTLPRPRGDIPIRVDGGAAAFTFRVPAGVDARVTTTGLLATSGPGETAGYATATDRVTVTVTGGVASVRLVPVGA